MSRYNKIGKQKLDDNFFQKLIDGNIYLIKEKAIRNGIMSKNEIEKITSQRAFEHQSKIQKSVPDLSKEMQNTCEKHFIQVVADWYKDIKKSKKDSKHIIEVCYKVMVIDEKEAMRRRKEVNSKNEKGKGTAKK